MKKHIHKMKVTIDGKTIEVSKETFEEVKSLVKKIEKTIKPKRWRAETGEEYWFTNSEGYIQSDRELRMANDGLRYLTGNYYQTKEQARKASDRKFALTRVWDWALENAFFEPDWDDCDDPRYFILFDNVNKLFDWGKIGGANLQSELPYFKSQKDAKRCIKENMLDLELIFNIEK